eukprot:COSAG01_NODE_23027_length_831_cov_1.120219_1_plen_53_part_10
MQVDVVYFCAFQPNAFGLWGIIFAVLCVAINIGGILWARGLWRGYRKFLAKGT